MPFHVTVHKYTSRLYPPSSGTVTRSGTSPVLVDSCITRTWVTQQGLHTYVDIWILSKSGICQIPLTSLAPIFKTFKDSCSLLPFPTFSLVKTRKGVLPFLGTKCLAGGTIRPTQISLSAIATGIEPADKTLKSRRGVPNVVFGLL